ncbi:MAG: hypothetical protein NTW29_14965 [Bacteroidetes bacterium]|nr:hypothetical protein [Bacteroidota bacterium]
MKEYISNNKISLFLRFLILLLPLFLGGYFILYKYEIFNFKDLSNYHINSVFIIFVLIGLVPVLLNLAFYLIDTFDLVFNYKGNNKKIKRINFSSFIGICILGVIITIFLFAIFTKQLTFIKIVEFNRWISLSIFAVFLVIDCLTWWSESIEKLEESDINKKELHNKNISFSKNSTFLINIPTFFIILLSLLFVHKLELLNYYFQFTDTKNFVIDLQINEKKDIIELFIVGIETGIIMTSIVFSQIIFYFIKTKWSYEVYTLQKSPAANN